MSWESLGYIVAGLVLLGLGGELVVTAGIRAARALRVPTVIIGVVLLGFGTSLPELVTSLRSVTAGEGDIALGNIVGSNIANLLLIAGAAAALAGAATTSRLVWRDGAVMLGATFAFAWILAQSAGPGLEQSVITPLVGGLLLAGLALFMLVAVLGWTAGGSGDLEAEIEEDVDGVGRAALPGALVQLAIGVALTVAGAWLLVEGAVALAEGAGLSKAVIGATIIAVGTSLPELATTISAAMRGRSDMAVGNIFGSNIFNILGIAGATALFGPLATPDVLLRLDVWVMIAATVLTLFMARSWATLSRSEGVLLLLLYALYLSLAASQAMA